MSTKLTAATVNLLLFALLLHGCSGVPEAIDSAVPGPATAAAPETDDPGPHPPTQEPSARPHSTSGAGDATDAPARTAELLFGGVEMSIMLRTPVSGGGSRPLLEWDPLSGADHYGVYLYAPSGDIYWAWTGHENQVHVGGEPQLREDAPGPRVVHGMSWAVIAYDADLLPVAVSELRPIAP